MNAETFALRRRLYIIFKGEKGLDFGGFAELMGTLKFNYFSFKKKLKFSGNN